VKPLQSYGEPIDIGRLRAFEIGAMEQPSSLSLLPNVLSERQRWSAPFFGQFAARFSSGAVHVGESCERSIQSGQLSLNAVTVFL
jgi:hypothetical protein